MEPSDYKQEHIITLSKIGWNHPSQANWSWGIWKLDLIKLGEPYCMSYTLKEQFGGDYRLKEAVKNMQIAKVLGIQIIETKGLFPQAQVKGIKQMTNMESEEVLKIIEEFLTK